MLDDKKRLRLLANDAGVCLTTFCTKLVESELVRCRVYESIRYPSGGPLVHVKLEDDWFNMLQTMAVQWDLPYRHAVHRLVANYLREPNPSDAMIISYLDP